jgi:hypothetical protein
MVTSLKSMAIPQVTTPEHQRWLKVKLLNRVPGHHGWTIYLEKGGLLADRRLLYVGVVVPVMAVLLVARMAGRGASQVGVAGNAEGELVEQVKVASLALPREERMVAEWRLGMNLESLVAELESGSNIGVVSLGEDSPSQVVVDGYGGEPAGGIELTGVGGGEWRSDGARVLGQAGVWTSGSGVRRLVGYTNSEGQRILVGLDQNLVPVARQEVRKGELGGQLNTPVMRE